MSNELQPDLLSNAEVEQFHRDGFLILRGFYDSKRQLEPIQRDIHRIIGILIQDHGLPIRQVPFSTATFDSGYQEVIAHDRKLGGVIYDAVKQIPAFLRLVCEERHDRLLAQLRRSDLPGVAAGGYGIRIDNPFEEKFRANWHQDYPYNLRSLDGLVFWAPLLPVPLELGPLILARGSHIDGLRRIVVNDTRSAAKPGAYAWHLEHEQDVVNQYPHEQFETVPGDLLVLDYLTLHASGSNIGKRSRWTMQMRYFNFLNEQGRQMDWRGGVNSGTQLKEFHPELAVEL